jgi:hypothetical protein
MGLKLNVKPDPARAGRKSAEDKVGDERRDTCSAVSVSHPIAERDG